MGEQKDLFGFEDMRPRVSLKKIITRERMEEVRKMLDSGDGRGAAERLEDIRLKLESLDKRISNGNKRK